MKTMPVKMQLELDIRVHQITCLLRPIIQKGIFFLVKRI